jgi:hypothetical protein
MHAPAWVGAFSVVHHLFSFNMFISVVIPCYNVAEYLPEVLASVWAQTALPGEVICVDDGSKDDTLSVLQGWQKDHSDLPMQIITGPNAGASTARNVGWQAAQGDWIQFLDADDLLGAQKLAHQASLIDKSSVPVDLVVGAFAKQAITGSVKEVQPFGTDPWVGLSRTQLGITSANLFRREAVAQVGGWDQSLRSSQEYDLMARMLACQESVLIDTEVHTTVRERLGGSITQSNRVDNWQRYIALRRRIWEVLKQQDKLTSERAQALGQSLLNALRCLHDYAPEEAVALHREVMPPDFRPASSTYGYMYQWLGFRYAERLSRLISPRI